MAEREPLVPAEIVEEAILELAADIRDDELEGEYSIFLFNAVRDAIAEWQENFE